MGESDIERVLIYRLGSLGDTVVALPALHLISRKFPNARRLLLTNIPVHAKAPAASAVLGSSGLVDGYISYPVGLRNVAQLARLWWKIRRFHPQLLVYLAAPRGDRAVRRDARFFRACGITQITGLPLGGFAEPIYFPESRLWEHESARLLRTIRTLGDCNLDDSRNWNLLLTEQEIGAASAALSVAAQEPLVVCGPGTKVQAKDWGVENWRQLLEKLSAALPDRALALVGAQEDAQTSEYAARNWRGTVVNLCGRLTPRESAAAIQGAELFLGPDSGPMHVAASLGVPCACVFAARAKPGTWYPFGQGHRVVYHRVDCMDCHLDTCIEQKKKCLTSVSVDEMLAAALGAWKNGMKRRGASRPTASHEKPLDSIG